VRFEEIEHTADVGIRAYGKNLGELFASAAMGMFSLIVEVGGVRPVGEVEVQVRGDDAPQLMFRWLSELLFLHETQHLLLSDFDVAVRGKSLSAKARGEAIDKGRHELKLSIKAVTYHKMIVDAKAGVAQIIFDI